MFKLKNTNKFPMPGGYPTPLGDYFYHLATIQDSLKEYICFICIEGPNQGKAYIEEVVLVSNSNNLQVSANLKQIDDDNLISDLSAFLLENGILDMGTQYNEMIDQGLIRLKG